MADDTRDIKPEEVDEALGDMKIEEGQDHQNHRGFANGTLKHVDSRSSTPAITKSSSQSPVKRQSTSTTPKSEIDEDEEVIGGDIVVTVEPGKAPKLSRKSSQKVAPRAPMLFDHVSDATDEALTVFQRIKDCIYGSKYMGASEHDALDCDCSEEWNDGRNHACGEDSDCINRATKMECVDGDCNCGNGCQNQRFQQRQYANVSVIKTEKKGYGLRANTDLQPNEFVFEYIGEVINEPTFRRRMIQYDEEGIKHFYFMSLTKHEFVDATKKGNLGRFCNHSCNPNAYVDKWVVGEKLRMGIFAERHIKAGEEIVFNYNVDRYGADPQPCYCAEPNCTGFIGGKTQTERATKLSHATIEALGIDDGDGWDTAVAKRPRKKKTGEDDEEYVNNVQPKGLDEEGVRKVMATLMQCKEKWIAVKLLDRIQRCDDDRVRNRVVQMHGYQILRSTLTTWKEDNNVILQILDILYKFPRLTRNKISDSKIETTIEGLTASDHEDVAFEAKRLIEEWSKLEVAYRIPRKKFDPNTVSVFDRRPVDRTEEVKKDAVIVAPTGPKNSFPQRIMSGRPIPRRTFNHPLPAGWFTAMDEKGNPYYYSKAGQTTWNRPFQPAAEPPPQPKAPSKSVQTAKALQDIIDSITRPDPSTQTTPLQNIPSSSTPKEKKPAVEKWRSLPQEKQMKIYENTLHPHVKHVMQKFAKQLPKEDLKKFAKEVGKKLVASDFKHGRVEDPTKISEKQEKKVKKYVKDYFEKVVEKKKAMDQRKQEKVAALAPNSTGSSAVNGSNKPADEDSRETVEDDDEAVDLTPNSPVAEMAPSVRASPFDTDSMDLKRKRTSDDSVDDDADSKRFKEDDVMPPPPPPPPPAEDIHDVNMLETEIDQDPMTAEETEEEKELRQQQEELERENEAAIKMDLDGTLKREELQSQKAHSLLASKLNGQAAAHDGGVELNTPLDNANGTRNKQDGLVSR